MEMCTPLATKLNGTTVNNTYLYPANCSEHEMEVTPCVRAYSKTNNKQSNQLSSYSAAKNVIAPIEIDGSTEVTSELEYSVVEAEEMFRKTSLRTGYSKTVPMLSDLPKPIEDRNYWVFFENVLKGFDDPQLG